MGQGRCGTRRGTPEYTEVMSRKSKEAGAKRRRAREQDVEWMASTGETTEGAAERLGIRPEGLYKWTTDAGRPDLWEKLRANEVARFGGTLAEIRRIERAAEQKGKRIGPRKVA